MSELTPPFQRFVLLCHQRSGSNALQSLLRRHPAVAIYGQLFNNSFEYKRHQRNRLGLPLFRAHPATGLHYGPTPPVRKRIELLALQFGRREQDLDRYLDAFWSRFPETALGAKLGAVGFKLHDFQLSDADLRRLCTQHVDRVVILTRRNLLKAAISWAVALRTGVWVRTKRSVRRPPLDLDVDEIAWFITKTQAEIARWHALAADINTPSLALDYETDVAPRRLKRLLEFLGVDPSFEAEFTTKRLASPTYAHVANAEALNEALGSPETGYLFDPTDPS